MPDLGGLLAADPFGDMGIGWPKPIEPEVVQTFALQAAGVTARQYAGMALTGHKIFPIQPFANRWIKTTAGLRSTITEAGERVGGKVAGKAAQYTAGAAKAARPAAAGAVKILAPKIPTAARPVVQHITPGLRAALRPAAGASGKALASTGAASARSGAWKIGARTGARAASRAIPVIGWGLLIADAGADIARVFGVDVTEWLGFSPMLSPLTGGVNPLENWAAGGAAPGSEAGAYNPAPETDHRGYYYIPEGYTAAGAPAWTRWGESLPMHLFGAQGQAPMPAPPSPRSGIMRVGSEIAGRQSPGRAAPKSARRGGSTARGYSGSQRGSSGSTGAGGRMGGVAYATPPPGYTRPAAVYA